MARPTPFLFDGARPDAVAAVSSPPSSLRAELALARERRGRSFALGQARLLILAGATS